VGGPAPAAPRRERLCAAWEAIGAHEQTLIERLIVGLSAIQGVRIYGITEREQWGQRVATVSIRKEGKTPEQLALALAAENIFAWNGNFYGLEISERLGVESSGGLLRIGLVHYNTVEEVDKCLRVLERM
jgi:selenocysteine lyase/cysteine desulfurase